MSIVKDGNISELPIYGSNRLGQYETSDLVPKSSTTLGQRRFEFSNHLGNVLVTMSDEGDILSYSDYYPFGLNIESRSWRKEGYRYGFNGKENDADLSSSQLIQDYGFRVYNPVIGKFLSVDPLTKSYPWYTPYQFAGNKPIWAVDLDGLEELVRTQYIWHGDGSTTLVNRQIEHRNGNWEGTRYRDGYFFENTGKYYSETGLDLNSTAFTTMQNDNPMHFAALQYHRMLERQSDEQLIFDGLALTGATVALTASIFTANPMGAMAAFNIMSSTFAVGATSSKLGFDLMGRGDLSAKIPSSPLGGVGRAMDIGFETDYFQSYGDLATNAIIISGSKDQFFKPSAFKKLDNINKWDTILTGEAGFEGILRLPHIGVFNSFDASKYNDNSNTFLKELEKIRNYEK
ncbi:hypothetical protein MY04_1376 [Flammeovirga sp. MY04]|uniref:RHS repeat domain-containing protein n=1 Tax=Flammeovirga sp. MY04 TaxID=1191459 RepID=UPI0008060D17|nr:RHS repeat-associated core domain-containing protein [Flammeovirga sp. MY04]ANQ48752.1 hypothetical protein MY04_1376 [Flammeovirga sp. MY04]